MDQTTVTEYAERMEDGDKFPPVTVYYDGATYWLADGFHRVEAAHQLQARVIEADVKQGVLEDAQWFSFGVNKNHGLRRSTADKQQAVRSALLHSQSAGKSDSQIASHVGVDTKTVGKYRSELELSLEIPKIEDRVVTRGNATFVQKTSNIGKRKAPSKGESFVPFAPTDQDIEEMNGYVFPPDTPQEVLEAAARPGLSEPSPYERHDEFLKNAKYDETVKLVDALKKLMRSDLHEFIYGPAGVYLGAPSMFRLVMTYGMKEQSDESKTITVN